MPRRVLAVLLVLAGACASGDGMQTKLQDAASGYNRYLRWGDHDRAAEYLPLPSRTAFLALYEDVGPDVVVVDYQVTRLQVDKGTGTAASRAEIQWHTDRRLIVETTVVDQQWQWYEGAWILVDERRSSGTPLALFAEPDETKHPYLPGAAAFRKALGIGDDKKRGSRP